MKQVVINAGGIHGELLNPYWIIKYLEKKGIKVYVYNQEVGLDNKWEYTYIEDISTLNNPKEIYTVYYLTKNVGKFLTEKEWDEFELNEDEEIDAYDLFENREDKDLIAIAKEINDEKLIKVIDIPNDVKYEIHESECGFGEWIQEVSRRWS